MREPFSRWVSDILLWKLARDKFDLLLARDILNWVSVDQYASDLKPRLIAPILLPSSERAASSHAFVVSPIACNTRFLVDGPSSAFQTYIYIYIYTYMVYYYILLYYVILYYIILCIILHYTYDVILYYTTFGF